MRESKKRKAGEARAYLPKKPQAKAPIMTRVPYIISRTSAEIDEQLNWADFAENEGRTAVRGMSYEQGVKAAIRWLIGHNDELPIEEEPEGYE